MKKVLMTLLLFSYIGASAQTTGPKVLMIMAHPDDETECAATIYKITHELRGSVDLAIVTNGEGGYKYSTLAEDYYGFELTEEQVGRKYLPLIRKQELKNAGKILGISRYYFLDQQDLKNTKDERNPLDTVWNVAAVKKQLENILHQTQYDFIFCLLPVDETHGHHKAATLLALDVVHTVPKDVRPVVLGVSSRESGKEVVYNQYKNYAETKANTNAITFSVNRNVNLGFKKALNYKIIVNWVIAEHKSQGMMQMGMGKGDLEQFWFFDINLANGLEKTKTLFQQLQQVPYPSKDYSKTTRL
jgi:LmbE family N-acetylglucosaminyl deacetylase